MLASEAPESKVRRSLNTTKGKIRKKRKKVQEGREKKRVKVRTERVLGV